MFKGINFWNDSSKYWTLPSFLDLLKNSKSSLDRLLCNFLKPSHLLSIHYELMPMPDTYIYCLILA